MTTKLSFFTSGNKANYQVYNHCIILFLSHRKIQCQSVFYQSVWSRGWILSFWFLTGTVCAQNNETAKSNVPIKNSSWKTGCANKIHWKQYCMGFCFYLLNTEQIAYYIAYLLLSALTWGIGFSSFCSWPYFMFLHMFGKNISHEWNFEIITQWMSAISNPQD